MSNTTLVWTFIVAFMIHEFEEMIFLVPWIKKHREEIFAVIPKPVKGLLHIFKWCSKAITI